MTSVSSRTLELALARGLVSPSQVEQLLALETGGAVGPGVGIDEAPRFVSGFADIFVTIGIVLFIGALAYFMGAGAGSTPMFAGVACCAWLLAEFFSGKRHMALPSIVLLLIFVAAVLVVSLQVFGSILPAPRHIPERFWFLPTENPAALAVAAICTAALAAMHYVRFHVPITVAVGAAALCLLAVGVALSIDPALGALGLDLVLVAAGIGVFALAMRFDMSDPTRVTRRADVAFWLHLLAAPLIIHPAVAAVFGASPPRFSPSAALGVLWAVALLGVVAVVVDRRALLVSALLYAGAALATLLRDAGGLDHAGTLLPLVLLLLGTFILLLGAGWQPLRRVLLRRLPRALSVRLPPS